jgi:hypothetical protein
VGDRPDFTKQVFIVQAVANAATIAGVLLTLLTPKWRILAGIALLATLAAQLKLYRESTKDTLHEFTDERGPAFVTYFEQWYDRNGNHDIYCKDLDWLDRPELEPIVAVLIRRSSQVNIFLREQGASVCQRLREAGVRLYLVPEVARSEMKMSLRSDNDDKELVIKTKDSGLNNGQIYPQRGPVQARSSRRSVYPLQNSVDGERVGPKFPVVTTIQ